MKKAILTLLAAFCANAQAFTLDFLAFNGTNLTSPSTLNVPVVGYGTLIFSTLPGQVIAINNTHGAVAANLDSGETLTVTFVGDPLVGGTFSFIGLNIGGNDDVSTTEISSNTYALNLATGDGVGLQSISWSAIPEPSTTMHGALGMLAVALRRRRA
jgi:outer membrane protein assembly factor BamB